MSWSGSTLHSHRHGEVKHSWPSLPGARAACHARLAWWNGAVAGCSQPRSGWAARACVCAEWSAGLLHSLLIVSVLVVSSGRRHLQPSHIHCERLRARLLASHRSHRNACDAYSLNTYSTYSNRPLLGLYSTRIGSIPTVFHTYSRIRIPNEAQKATYSI